MTATLDAFKAEVAVKLGGLTSEEYIAANPGQHLYAVYGKWASCAFCGMIQPRDRTKQSKCRGIVRITTR